MSRINIAALIERGEFVRFAIVVRVFDDKDAVTLSSLGRVFVFESPIIDGFANPNAPEVIDVDICRIEKLRL